MNVRQSYRPADRNVLMSFAAMTFVFFCRPASSKSLHADGSGRMLYVNWLFGCNASGMLCAGCHNAVGAQIAVDTRLLISACSRIDGHQRIPFFLCC